MTLTTFTVNIYAKDKAITDERAEELVERASTAFRKLMESYSIGLWDDAEIGVDIRND